MRPIAIFSLGIFLFLLNTPAWGDAKIESMVKTGGFKGMGASEGTELRQYQGDRMSATTNTKFTGAILSVIGGGGESVAITRLDKGVYWNLDPKNKTYTEKAIEPFKMGEAKEEKTKEKTKVRVTRSEVTVVRTGASENINGFPCEEYLLTWVLEMEDLETKAKTRTTMTSNLWTTPETDPIRKAREEEAQFARAYARKLGIDLSPEAAKQLGMEALGAMSGASPEAMAKGFKILRNEMSKISGYPIRSVVKWAGEGDKAAAPAKEEQASSGSVADIPKSVGGFLSGLAGKVTQKVTGEKPSSASGKDEPFFSSTTEVKAVSVDSIPPEVFEIPPGYVKK
jgi:hypothetical protein